MFVKNLVDVMQPTQAVIITHTATIYTGNVANIPFYLLNEKVVAVGISSSSIAITI